MKGYYTGYAYCGIMPDGRKAYFATDQEYKETYDEEEKELGLLFFANESYSIMKGRCFI